MMRYYTYLNVKYGYLTKNGLEKQLRDALRKLEEIENPATQAEQQVYTLEDHLYLARNDLGKWMEAKDHAIQQWKRKLAQQQDVAIQQIEQMQELEDYIRIQEDYFAERMSESILHAIVAQKEHNHGKERLQVENENLINIFAEIEVKYE